MKSNVTNFGYSLLGATPLSFSAMLSSANKADLKPNGQWANSIVGIPAWGFC